MESSSLKILYYGAGWPTNIGNAFIDLGAMALLRSAIPEATFAFASEMPRWFFSHRQQGRLRFGRRAHESRVNNALDVAALTECDLVVFAGMAMCEEFIEVNGPPVLTLSQRGVPILLLGTGGASYSPAERTRFADFLRQVRPIGFVSRDDDSYELFADMAPRVYRGIDCAFFLPEAYTPFSLHLQPFVVAAFDATQEPVLDLKGRLLVRTHHDCWGPIPARYSARERTLISDIPYDYLTLYANAEEVHSDRVHACVAALAYGRKARLYHPTPRGSLFDAVGGSRIREGLTELDPHLLGERKAALICFVQEIVRTQVRPYLKAEPRRASRNDVGPSM